VKVTSGPSEATALGNIIVQLISLGELKNLQEGRALIAKSANQSIFEPQAGQDWTKLAERLQGYSQ
jgi:sugar (pentulose or hexulose) kinase